MHALRTVPLEGCVREYAVARGHLAAVTLDDLDVPRVGVWRVR